MTQRLGKNFFRRPCSKSVAIPCSPHQKNDSIVLRFLFAPLSQFSNLALRLIAFLVVHMPKGFAAAQGGYEYVLLLGVVLLAMAIRGGGQYSLDRVIGKEL